MLDANTLKRAVELADGWDIAHVYAGEDIVAFWEDRPSEVQADTPDIDFLLQAPTQSGLDALTVQLWRQVKASKNAFNLALIHIAAWDSEIDISENIINAIVQNGVLEKTDENNTREG